MQCIHPLYAIDYHKVKANGKKTIRILRSDEIARFKTYDDLINYYGRDNVIKLPCGKCDACKKNYAQQWAVRCTLEAKEYLNNIFLTLTYEDEFLPSGDLDQFKKDFTDFIKAIRNDGHKIRYFGCGEYGSKTEREHHHLILFNFKPADAKYFSTGSNGGHYFTSEYISKLWKKGHIIFCDFEFATAKYVASYVLGEYKNTAFIRMSRKPGIGFKYLDKNYEDIYSGDLIYGNFGKQKTAHPPRAFDEYVKDHYNLDLTSVCDKRKRKGEDIEADMRAKTGSIYQHHFESFLQRKLDKKNKRSL